MVAQNQIHELQQEEEEWGDEPMIPQEPELSEHGIIGMEHTIGEPVIPAALEFEESVNQNSPANHHALCYGWISDFEEEDPEELLPTKQEHQSLLSMRIFFCTHACKIWSCRELSL